MAHNFAPPKRTQRSFQPLDPDRYADYNPHNQRPEPYPTDHFNLNWPYQYNHHGHSFIVHRVSFHPYSRQFDRQFSSPRAFRKKQQRLRTRIAYNKYTPRKTEPPPLRVTSSTEVVSNEMQINVEDPLAGARDCQAGSLACDVPKQLDSNLHSQSRNLEGPQFPEISAESEFANLEVTISCIFSLINEFLPHENKESILRGFMEVFKLMKGWVPDDHKDAALAGLIGKLTDALTPEEEHCRQNVNSGLLASEPECPIYDKISQPNQRSAKNGTSADHVECGVSLKNVEQSKQQPVARPQIRLILKTKADSESKVARFNQETTSFRRKCLERGERSQAVVPPSKLSKRDRKNRSARGVSLATPVTRDIPRAKRRCTPFSRKRPGIPDPHSQLDETPEPGRNALRTRCASVRKKAAKTNIVEIRDEGNRLTGFQCSLCPQMKPKKNAMTRHMKYHGAEERFSCHRCDFAADSRRAFNEHLKYHPNVLDEERSVRKETGDWEMDESGKDYANSQAKNSNPQFLPCVDPSCRYLGENCTALAEHVQREHSICSDEAKETNALPAAVEDRLKFQCCDCPAAFESEGRLIVHSRRVHSKRHHLDAL